MAKEPRRQKAIKKKPLKSTVERRAEKIAKKAAHT
jgi:hypothetical protein